MIPSNNPVRVLHLEGLPADAKLIDQLLEEAKVNLDIKVVNSRTAYIDALKEFAPEIIISDHLCPSFNSLQALDILKESELEIPFILVTGTVTEEFAAEVMKNGASDYILKDRPQRLPLAFLSALRYAKLENERKEAAVTLKNSERKYADLLQHLPAHIVLLDKGGVICDVNKLWKDFFNTNSFERLNYGIGCTYHDIIKLCYSNISGDGQKLETALSKILSGELESYSGIHQYYLQNSTKWFKVIVTREDESRDSGIVVMHIDITEQQVSEQLIRESEVKYRAFFENSMDGILLTSPNGEIISANPAACYIFQMSEQEICAAGRAGLVDASDPHLEMFIEERRRTGSSKGELNFIRKDGSKFPGEVTSAVFTDAYGQERTSMMIRDVTLRKQAEQERFKLTSDLIQHSKNLEQFAHIVSHSLRAPIASILGINNVLKGNVSGQDRIEIQEYLFAAVQQLDEVVKDINDILHLRFDVTESRSEVNLEELVNGIRSSIQNLIQKEQVQIETDFSLIDRTISIKSYMHSIFYNIILNSIKFRKPNDTPVIRIKSEMESGKLKITFKDSGIGIDLNKYGKDVFGLYKRFHPTIEGKGIGLFMVKTQVESLGGCISIKSEKNGGAEFIIELPMNFSGN